MLLMTPNITVFLLHLLALITLSIASRSATVSDGVNYRRRDLQDLFDRGHDVKKRWVSQFPYLVTGGGDNDLTSDHDTIFDKNEKRLPLSSSLSQSSTTTKHIGTNNSNMIKGGDLVTSLSSNDVVRSNDINHVSSYKTQGMRPYQEDEMLIQGPNSHDANSSYFLGVFDGHGGHAVSRYLKQNLFAAYLLCRRRSRESSALLLKKVDGNSKNMQGSEELGNYFTPSIDEPGASVENLQNGNNFFDDDGLVRISIDALQMAFEKVDQEVQRVSHWSFQGSTAVVVLLLKLQNQRIIVSANVGDSRAVVCQRYCPSKLNEGCNTVITAVDLTVDHKPNVLSERNRIEKLGGCITKPTSSGGVHRINGNLAVSRAIGDRSEKPWVSSQVDIKIHATSINTDVIDEFIIMASDGLWDVMSSAEAVSLCREYVERRHYKIGQYVDRKDMHDQLYWKDIYDEVPKYLTSEAIRRGSSDNISVIITWLRRDVGIDNGEDL
eukprot:CAMPEP_0194437586 /NCGR_PEP_ID=MMETSP0176-20130528/100686_1 /TAXON_ID=216777 /ORGANISM="Proboscia alata, Strain PI-D3" /LENGTH=493 /DNA_ID=CAMNT_0039258965 /DNA_START=35 /DNA_END=1516 /DNA_ORIENTATION=-